MNDQKGFDTLRLVGLTKDEVEIYSRFSVTSGSYNYYHLIVFIPDTGESILMDSILYSNRSGGGMTHRNFLDAIEFGDGTTMTTSEIIQSGVIKEWPHATWPAPYGPDEGCPNDTLGLSAFQQAQDGSQTDQTPDEVERVEAGRLNAEPQGVGDQEPQYQAQADKELADWLKPSNDHLLADGPDQAEAGPAPADTGLAPEAAGGEADLAAIDNQISQMVQALAGLNLMAGGGGLSTQPQPEEQGQFLTAANHPAF